MNRVDEPADELGAAATSSQGEPLAQYLGRVGRLPMYQGLAFAGQLLHALDDLHRCGHVHGAITSGHLLVTRGGRLRVPGAGGEPAVPPPCAAPDATEQASASALDQRKDLVAAAIVTYELLTGAHPFRPGDALDLPRPVREFRPELPPQLDSVFRRALAPLPDDGYRTAADVWAAVQAAVPAPCWTRPALVRAPVHLEEPASAGPEMPASKARALSHRPGRGAVRPLAAALVVGCAVLAAAAMLLPSGTTPASPGESIDLRAAGAGRDLGEPPMQAAGGLVVRDAASSLSSNQSSDSAVPALQAAAMATGRDISAPMPDRHDPELAPQHAAAPAIEQRRHDRPRDRTRLHVPEPRMQRVARPGPPDPVASCQQDVAIAPELCTVFRCATAEFRQHPVCVRLHAEGARARASLAESRGGP